MSDLQRDRWNKLEGHLRGRYLFLRSIALLGYWSKIGLTSYPFPDDAPLVSEVPSIPLVQVSPRSGYPTDIDLVISVSDPELSFCVFQLSRSLSTSRHTPRNDWDPDKWVLRSFTGSVRYFFTNNLAPANYFVRVYSLRLTTGFTYVNKPVIVGSSL